MFACQIWSVYSKLLPKQFTHKRHLNQLRKRLTDEVDSKPPKETVMDVIYDTFNIPTPLVAAEILREKGKQLI